MDRMFAYSAGSRTRVWQVFSEFGLRIRCEGVTADGAGSETMDAKNQRGSDSAAELGSVGDGSFVQQTTIMVMAKNPVPGFCKTRLCPPCTPEQAATAAAESLRDTLAAIESVENVRLLLVIDRLQHELPIWLAGIPQIDQVTGGLDRRLAAAFDAVDGPAILVGMDTPQIPASVLADAVRLVENGASVLGMASDGGFWCIGFHHRPEGVSWAELFHNVPMSTDTTGTEQLQRLVAKGCEVTLLTEFADFDTFADLLRLAEVAPDSRVGRLVLGDEWQALSTNVQESGTH